jgi:D-lactate dehydrogenase
MNSATLLAQLEAAVGKRNLLTGERATAPYRAGFRFGGGAALAVAKPRSLVAFWRALEACVEGGAAVIVQAANTGLTGGSTPFGDDYDRPLVIISPMAIDGIHLIEGGRQVVCLPGATLNRLEALLKPLGREPHSVIGSSCIGASVMGGICNNSGGALIRRGPAYTELALYARLDEAGKLCLVNHLGIRLEGAPEAALERIERGDFSVEATNARASDGDYERRVRAVDAPTPARFNADAERLFEASGCAGKLALFAVRLDTFPADSATRTYYVGTNDPGELTRLRHRFLGELTHLPVSAEYMHRDCFDMADRYGKDTFVAIRALGTDWLPLLNGLKGKVESAGQRLGLKPGISDRVLQRLGRLFPDHLPRRLRDYRERFEHHLILRVAGDGIAEAEGLLGELFPSRQGDVFVCSDDEAERAFLHRFVAAGAAVRYRATHKRGVEDIVALDIALPRNATDWFETLPPEIESRVSHKLYYGHFFCHVFHQDYVVRCGHDPMALEHDLCALQDRRGAEYPAEHNVGHLYPAKPQLAAHYRALDPCNVFNPGVGQLSKRAGWA